MHRRQLRSSPRSPSVNGLIRPLSMLKAFSRAVFRCFLTSDCIASSRLPALSFSLRRSSASAVFFETLIVVVSFKMDSPKKHMAMQVYKYTCMQQPMPRNSCCNTHESDRARDCSVTGDRSILCFTTINTFLQDLNEMKRELSLSHVYSGAIFWYIQTDFSCLSCNSWPS